MIKPTTELTTTATKLGVIILFDANILNWLCWVEGICRERERGNERE